MRDGGLPLSGQRVLITRPSGQADSLTRALQEKGADTVRFPTLEIQRAEDYCATLEPLKRCFLDLDNYQLVIFVSSNAARLAWDWIDSYWPQLPLGVIWLAVGEATRKTLLELDIPAHSPQNGMDSEALMALPALQQLENKRILICKGSGGREYLAEQLRAKGASVDYAELYRREIPKYSAQDIESIIYKSLPSVMLVSSQQSLENLEQLCGGENGSLPIHQLRQLPLIVPSQRVAQKAHQLGYSQVNIAQNATDSAMINALQHLLQHTTADDEHGKVHE